LDQSLIYSVGGFLLASLLAIIGFFVKREMRSLDKAKEIKANEDKALLNSLSEISEAIAEMRVKLENFDGLNEEINKINSKLEIMRGDNSSTRHEIELMNQMITPLFDLKSDVSRTQQDITNLFNKFDSLKESYHRIEKELILLNKIRED
jgi:chromosome segregation ATPase